MLTFAIALADKWQGGIFAPLIYIIAVIADASWLTAFAEALAT